MSESDDLPEKSPRKRSRRWPSFAALAVILLCGAVAAWRYHRVAAVQDTLRRDYEIAFGDGQRPFLMPEILDEALQKYLAGKSGTWKRYNSDIIYGERIRAILRGDIPEIHIYYHEGFRNELGAALLRFPELKKLTLHENSPHSGDYKLLCESIRRLPKLEELELGGDQLSDDAIASLAGHPKLKKLNVSRSGFLTPDVLRTLKSLPKLNELHVEQIYGAAEKAWKSPAVHAGFREQLPGVKIELPQP
ncbi:hypothetical protein [Roseimicrobium sp. ORNL1]|uniref:hypothetical protein n=1 Tax=Roseimicrobium sp. ORNL1 TaxID=2711231 RepID=UPI0013E1D02B|nr:hypothetical protein [Roseimicrobium sp. ORNL1]QIF02659.1 hypothetical protein G5S37_14370 [Roseimicrobium sp. ORNL1]